MQRRSERSSVTNVRMEIEEMDAYSAVSLSGADIKGCCSQDTEQAGRKDNR